MLLEYQVQLCSLARALCDTDMARLRQELAGNEPPDRLAAESDGEDCATGAGRPGAVGNLMRMHMLVMGVALELLIVGLVVATSPVSGAGLIRSDRSVSGGEGRC